MTTAKDPVTRRGLLGVCAAAGTVGLAGCTTGSLDAESTSTREFDGADVSELAVETTNGDLSLQGGS